MQINITKSQRNMLIRILDGWWIDNAPQEKKKIERILQKLRKEA